jgi:hypothetical protein
LEYRHELGMNYAHVLPDLIVGSCLQVGCICRLCTLIPQSRSCDIRHRMAPYSEEFVGMVDQISLHRFSKAQQIANACQSF